MLMFLWTEILLLVLLSVHITSYSVTHKEQHDLVTYCGRSAAGLTSERPADL